MSNPGRSLSDAAAALRDFPVGSDAQATDNQRKAVLCLCASAAAWALIEIIGGFADVSPSQIVWTRYAVQLLVLLVVWGPRRGATLVRTRRPAIQIARSLLMLGMPLSYIAAVRRIGLPDTLALFWVAPLLCVFASGAERQARPAWIAGWLGYAGALLIIHPTALHPRLALVLPLAMAACFAGYQWLTEQLTEDAEATNLFHSALWVFAALTLAMPHRWHTPAPSGWLAMTVVGLLGLICLFFLDRGLRMVPARRIAPALYLQPLIGLLVVAAMTHQHLAASQLAGGAMVVASICVLWL